MKNKKDIFILCDLWKGTCAKEKEEKKIMFRVESFAAIEEKKDYNLLYLKGASEAIAVKTSHNVVWFKNKFVEASEITGG